MAARVADARSGALPDRLLAVPASSGPMMNVNTPTAALAGA
jgi:hypothetical protein